MTGLDAIVIIEFDEVPENRYDELIRNSVLVINIKKNHIKRITQIYSNSANSMIPLIVVIVVYLSVLPLHLCSRYTLVQNRFVAKLEGRPFNGFFQGTVNFGFFSCIE